MGSSERTVEPNRKGDGALSQPIYILGGHQTDFGRNFAREELSIFDLLKEEKELRQLDQSDDYADKKKALAKKKFENRIVLAKMFGDLMNASTNARIPAKLGFAFKETQIAAGGLTSALVTCYQQFPAAKK